MADFNGLGLNLGNLSRLSRAKTRSISPENFTGEKGKGGMSTDGPAAKNARDLGQGWKVSPYVRIEPGQVFELADIAGPGCINEFFITSDLSQLRALVLRFYWDGEDKPSVEVPMGDFFAMGHDHCPHLVNSLPVVVGPRRACSCYWQMPFRTRALITIQNEGPQDAKVVAYRVLYKLHDVPDDTAYFHAQWRRSMTRRDHPEHVILDGVKGKGLYVGTYLAWSAFSRAWWGEGEVKFYIDGDGEFPSMADNGTEDYFGGAWGFVGPDGKECEFSTPFLGLPLAKLDDPRGPRNFSLYRWHVLDSIGFAKDFRATVQALGWWPGGRYEPLTDDIASVGYWYQTEPHAEFPSFPPVQERWGR